MTLNAWEMSYNGLTFGGNDEIGILDVEGLALPKIREDTTIRVAEHGAFDYSRYYDPRYITVHGDISDATTFHTQVNALKQAFSAQASEKELLLSGTYVSAMSGGYDASILCKPLRLEFPTDRDFMLGYTDWVAQLIATDPLIYKQGNWNTAAIAGAGGSLAVTHYYTGSVYPNFVIDGPATAVSLRNITSEGTFYVNWAGTLLSGEVLEINFAARTARIIGGSSVYGGIDFSYPTTWWRINPGYNDITATITGGAKGVTLTTMNYRSAWI